MDSSNIIKETISSYKNVIKSFGDKNRVLQKEVDEFERNIDMVQRQIILRKKPYGLQLKKIEEQDKVINDFKKNIEIARKTIGDLEENLKSKQKTSREEFKTYYDECDEINNSILSIKKDIERTKKRTEEKIYDFRRDNGVDKLEREVSELKRKIEVTEDKIRQNEARYLYFENEIKKVSNNL